MNVRIYASLTRPKFQVPSIISMFVGVLFAFYLSQHLVFSLYNLVLAILITGPFIAGGALVLNQVYDYDSDKESTKKVLPIPSGLVSRRAGFFVAIFLFSLGLVFSYLIGIQTSIVTLLAVILSIAYSTPPIRLKSRRILDSVSNGLCYGFCPTLVGWTIFVPLSFLAIIMCIPLFLLFTANHLLLAIPDIEDDRKSSIFTTAVVLGKRKALTVGWLLWLTTGLVVIIFSILGIFPSETLIVLLPIAYAIAQLIRTKDEPLKSLYSKLKVLSILMGAIFLLAFILAIY